MATWQRAATAMPFAVAIAACLFPSLSDLSGSDGATSDVSVVETGVPEGAALEAGVPEGAALYFPFEEGVGTTTNDKAGSNTGTLVGGSAAITWAPSGHLGGAIVFNGAAVDGGGYVDIPSSKTSALNTTGSISVTAWINASKAPVDDAPIVSNQVNYAPVSGFQLDTTIDKGPGVAPILITPPCEFGASALVA